MSKSIAINDPSCTPTTPSTPSAGQRQSSDRQDASLRTKLALIILAASIGGSLIGMMGLHASHAVVPMWAGLALLAGGLTWLGNRWIWTPFNELLSQLDQISRLERPARIQPALVTRNDEIGRFAKGFNRCADRGLRDYFDARQLRRSLDLGVEKATRQATSQLRRLAMADPLTGLGNRRFLDENLDALIASSLNSNTELACIAIDMDKFKQVNDTLGHAVGDELLLFLADLIRGNKRKEDYAVRLGGDEFVVLMPGCQLDRAEAFAQQLLALFRQHTRTVLSIDVLPDLSAGISVLNEAMTSGQDLLEAADQNLYAAKRNGRGRVVTDAVS